MHQIIIKPKAQKQFDNLPKDIQIRILSALERTRIRPERFFKRLVGKELYKLRMGQYRIIAELKNKDLIILVIEIGHRKNIYK